METYHVSVFVYIPPGLYNSLGFCPKWLPKIAPKSRALLLTKTKTKIWSKAVHFIENSVCVCRLSAQTTVGDSETACSTV